MNTRLDGITVFCILMSVCIVMDSSKADDQPATTKQLTPDALNAAVKALKKDDVAWRRIDWKTCLLDGLDASREQHKPIVLWIFIDRPIDDERC